MHRTDTLLISVLLFTGLSCIKPYDPDILGSDLNKYVVTGQVSDNGEPATVNISRSSPISAPEYLPVPGCLVVIYDDNGSAFPMEDIGDGDYEGAVDPDKLVTGARFKVEVHTPQDEILSSDFDTLSSSPPVDSVYYIREDREKNSPGQFTLGIQFYVNLRAGPQDSRYYRWDITETWEHQSPYAYQWYYDGAVHHVFPPDSSLMFCWTTAKVPDIFTLSTANLEQNRYDLFPLQYVSNRNPRLLIGYSILIKQYGLSEAAYVYWDQLRKNIEQQGGLYERQPLAIQGNMHNLTHPDAKVLGFFGASSMTSKRIFVNPVPGLPLDVPVVCGLRLLRNGLIEITPDEYPAYLYGDEHGYIPLTQFDKECIDCRALGGTTVKPGFWPN